MGSDPNDSVHVSGPPCGRGHTLRYRASGHCVECTRISSQNNPGRDARWRAAHPDRVALRAAKYRAKRDGIPFSLAADDLPPIPASCPVLGIPLEPSSGKASDSSPSLDRIVPELGYVPGNVHWISYRANRIKSDATPEELRKVADYFTRLQIEEP